MKLFFIFYCTAFLFIASNSFGSEKDKAEMDPQKRIAELEAENAALRHVLDKKNQEEKEVIKEAKEIREHLGQIHATLAETNAKSAAFRKECEKRDAQKKRCIIL